MEKVDVFGVRCNPSVRNLSGAFIVQKTSIQYLGALISADGSIQSELNRRIGMATADFKILNKVWTHTKVTNKEKYRIYITLIVSKLLYGLQTAWLTKRQRSKLDGFHAKCVRIIVGVAHSYWSRVTNVEVLSYVDGQWLSGLLLEQQLIVFGKIYRRPLSDPLRKVIFRPGSDELMINSTRRRRGRTKLSWAAEVRKIAKQISPGELGNAMEQLSNWKKDVRNYCRISYENGRKFCRA